MKILMITNNDPAGMAIAFTNAINRYTNHQCRLISMSEKYGFDYESDIYTPNIHDDDFDEIEYLLRHSDIIHFHMLMDENMHVGPFVIRDYIKGQQIIHHHHGHPDYMINYEKYNEKYRKLGRKVIVSTPDLLKLAENSIWVPNLVPLNDVHYMPRFEDNLSDETIKICQAPTRKYDKHTSVFEKVMHELQTVESKIERVVLERIPHIQCLKIKRKCHIIFDHMRGWFGISSLESLSQGKPVIAGLDDWNIQCIKKFTSVDDLPWQIARNECELKTVLTKLINDKDLRESIGKESRSFMERYWTEKQALQILFEVYG